MRARLRLRTPKPWLRNFRACLKAYHVNVAYADRYGAEWVRGAFERHGISLRQSPHDRSSLYLNLLPALNAGQVKLLDLPRLRAQLLSLERRTIRGSGRDVIDHPTGGGDDLVNAAAGALVLAASAENRKINWSAAAGDASVDTKSGRRLYQHGNYVSDGKNLTKLPEPPPPPADLSYVWDEVKQKWVKPWIDPNSR